MIDPVKNDLNVSGILKMNDVEAAVVKVAGMFKVRGNLICDNLKTAGMMTVLGKAVVLDETKISGTLHIKEDLKTKSLKGAGSVTISSIEAETIEINGKLKVENTINCDQLTIALQSKSTVETIEASHLVVTNSKNRKLLHANTISADTITVENLVCERMTGDQITIGPRCKIKYLEYKTSVKIDRTAKVLKQQKM